MILSIVLVTTEGSPGEKYSGRNSPVYRLWKKLISKESEDIPYEARAVWDSGRANPNSEEDEDDKDDDIPERIRTSHEGMAFDEQSYSTNLDKDEINQELTYEELRGRGVRKGQTIRRGRYGEHTRKEVIGYRGADKSTEEEETRYRTNDVHRHSYLKKYILIRS